MQTSKVQFNYFSHNTKFPNNFKLRLHKLRFQVGARKIYTIFLITFVRRIHLILSQDYTYKIIFNTLQGLQFIRTNRKTSNMRDGKSISNGAVCTKSVPHPPDMRLYV